MIMNQYYAGTTTPSNRHSGAMAETILAEQKKSACIALLWLKGSPNEAEKRHVLQTLNSIDGVMGLKFMREDPTVMMVDYCGKQVKVEHLIRKVAASGSVIRRVGC